MAIGARLHYNIHIELIVNAGGARGTNEADGRPGTGSCPASRSLFVGPTRVVEVEFWGVVVWKSNHLMPVGEDGSYGFDS